MRMPGFTGEAALYLTSSHYQMTAGERRSASRVRPQQQRVGQVVPTAGGVGNGDFCNLACLLCEEGYVDACNVCWSPECRGASI